MHTILMSSHFVWVNHLTWMSKWHLFVLDTQHRKGLSRILKKQLMTHCKDPLYDYKYSIRMWSECDELLYTLLSCTWVSTDTSYWWWSEWRNSGSLTFINIVTVHMYEFYIILSPSQLKHTPWVYKTVWTNFIQLPYSFAAILINRQVASVHLTPKWITVKN